MDRVGLALEDTAAMQRKLEARKMAPGSYVHQRQRKPAPSLQNQHRLAQDVRDFLAKKLLLGRPGCPKFSSLVQGVLACSEMKP